MRTLSLQDLLLSEELKHIKNEVMLIHPDNDVLVFSIIEKVGFDITKAITYEPSKHRTMAGRVVIGYQVIGEYSRDKKYRHFLDTMDKVIVAGMTDVSLARHLVEIMGKRNSYNNEQEQGIGSGNNKGNNHRYYSDDELLEMGYSDVEPENATEYIEDDWESVMAQIKQLEEIRDFVRGGK